MSEKNQNGQPWYLISIVLVAVLGGLLFGYDTAVISGAEKGLQAFFRSARDFTYTDALHGFTTSSALIGCVIGALLSGVLTSRLGRRRSLLIAGMLFFLSALGSYSPEFLLFPHGVACKGVLVAFIFYRILGGVGVGLASAICPMYIAEVAPASQRGKLVSWNQFAIIFGQLVVYFVNFLIIQSHKNDPMIVEWTNTIGWRNMFVSEAFPAGLFTLLILLVPESPRHLVILGLDDKALKILTRINGEKQAKVILQDIKETVVERREKLFAYGYMVIFIGCMLSVSDNMLFTVIMGIINISFTLVAVFTVEKLGRKPLLISGSIGMAIGALGVALSNVVTMPAIVPVISIMVYSACFMFSWGPICWVYIAELFPNTIRSQATALAVAFQWIFNFIVSSTFVPMYNMKLGAMGESFGHFFAYALYGIICVAAAIFVWRLVPETKGKTLEDMTTLWRERSNTQNMK